MGIFKAQRLAQQLQERIPQQRVGTTITANNTDSNGIPSFRLANGSEVVWFQVAPAGNAGRVNSVGLSQPSYAPHEVSVLLDSTASVEAFRQICVALAAATGCKVLVYTVNPLPSTFDLAGATLIASLYPDATNKLTNQQ